MGDLTAPGWAPRSLSAWAEEVALLAADVAAAGAAAKAWTGAGARVTRSRNSPQLYSISVRRVSSSRLASFLTRSPSISVGLVMGPLRGFRLRGCAPWLRAPA